MKLTIGHLYPDLLNLYGDRGNIQCLMKRCQWRGIEAETISFELNDTIDFPDWISCFWAEVQTGSRCLSAKSSERFREILRHMWKTTEL